MTKQYVFYEVRIFRLRSVQKNIPFFMQNVQTKSLIMPHYVISASYTEYIRSAKIYEIRKIQQNKSKNHSAVYCKDEDYKIFKSIVLKLIEKN